MTSFTEFMRSVYHVFTRITCTLDMSRVGLLPVMLCAGAVADAEERLQALPLVVYMAVMPGCNA